MTVKQRISADDALLLYQGMGRNRSIRELRQVMINSGSRAPSLSTLLEWSRKHDWVAKAREYDAEVAREATERLQAEHASLVSATSVAWLKATGALIDRVTQLAPNAEGIEALVDAAVALAREGREIGVLPMAQIPSDGPANGATGGPSPVPTPAANPERDIFAELLPQYVNAPTPQSLEIEEHDNG